MEDFDAFDDAVELQLINPKTKVEAFMVESETGWGQICIWEVAV